MTDQNEFSGKTVEDAIADGLRHLGLNQDQVDIEVLNKGSRGILGFGSEASVVRIIPHVLAPNPTDPQTTEASSPPIPDAVTADASATVQPIDQETQVEASISLEQSAPNEPVKEDEGDPDGDDDYDDEYDYGEITDDELGEMAADLLAEMIGLMGLEAEVTTVWKDPEPGDNERCLQLDVHGNDLGALIGRQGETLSSVQFLLRLMVNQKIHAWQNIVVDVENYKAKRSAQLVQMAERMAAQVAETGRAMSLESMPSNERRIVHLTLRDHPDVYTESSGESERRKVHVIPRD